MIPHALCLRSLTDYFLCSLPDVMEVIPAGEVDKAFEGKTVIASIESVKAEEEAEAAKMAEAEIQETLAEEDAAEEVSTGEAPVAEA